MASSARPKKSRPGQSAKSKAQLNANKRAAAAEYNQVESKPFDIKTLVAQVSTANEKKKLSSTRVSKKEKEQAVLEAQVAAAETQESRQEASQAASELLEARTLAKDKLAELQQRKASRKIARQQAKAPTNNVEDDKVWAAGEAVRLLEVMISVVEEAADDRKDPAPVVPYYRKAKLAVAQLPAGSDSRLVLFNKMVLLTKRYKALFEQEQPGSASQKTNQPQAKKRHPLLGEKGKTKPWKSLRQALSLLGQKVDDTKGTLKGGSKATASIVTGVVSGVGSFIVKSTAQVGSSLREIGKAIRENGLDTLKWVGSRLHDLGSKVMGLFRSAKNFLGGGDATDLLAMAAIAMGILPSLVSGMNEELKKQFGDNYISDFISKHWEATKTAVMDWIFSTVDKVIDAVKDIGNKVYEKGKELVQGAVDAVISPAQRQENVSKWQASTYDKTPRVPPKIQLARLFKELNAPGATDAQKESVKIKIQQLVADNPVLAEDTHVMNKLNKYGISLSANVTKGAVTSTSNVSVPSSTSPSASGSATAANTAVALPGSSGGDTNVTVSQPPQSVGDTPVTATKPPPPSPTSDAGASSDPGASGGAKTSGLSNSAVPNQAVPDTLAFMNLAGMGMT